MHAVGVVRAPHALRRLMEWASEASLGYLRKRSAQPGTGEGVRMEARRARTAASAGGLVHDSRPRKGHASAIPFRLIDTRPTFVHHEISPPHQGKAPLMLTQDMGLLFGLVCVNRWSTLGPNDVS
jgi:hypothetical protein